MIYLRDGLEVKLHAHPCDVTCHWHAILKPIAFTVMHSSELTEVLVRSHLRNGNSINTDDNTFAKWLSRVGSNGYLNLLNVFLLVLDFRGAPSHPDISARYL